jgi:hypothetical protein
VAIELYKDEKKSMYNVCVFIVANI